ncbi:MAG: signal peptidase II [Clostridiales bacterium]|nr:signal peptidase II [Clostridiales bacterium]
MRRALAAAAMAALIIADRLIKIAAETSLKGSADYPKIDGFLALRYVENTGAAFGILSGRTKLLALFTGLVLLAGTILLMIGKIKDNLLFAAAVLIVSGGLGNFYDRVFVGYVVDYIELLFVKFAVFNFADCLITVGSALVIIYIIIDAARDAKRKRGSGS